MPLEVVVPLIVIGSALPLGFFLVRAAGRDFIMTRMGATYRRASNPGGYWFWTIYHWTGFAFIVAMLPLILLGLLFSQ